MNEIEYLTVKQAASRMRRTRQTIMTWIKSGKLPAKRLGKVYCILPEDLDALYLPVQVSVKPVTTVETEVAP
jgi:excisionase family DNA binding protein